MKFRIANVKDSKVLAQLHFISGMHQTGGFMHKLGIRFLERYYQISFLEKNIVILIAEDRDGIARGFISGTLDAFEHVQNLRNHKFSLAIASIPSIFKNPRIITDLLSRKNTLLSNRPKKKYIVEEGARGEYWAWLPEDRSALYAGVLRQAWLNILFELGCKVVRYELDLGNSSFEKFEKVFGCSLIEELTLPDGRKRVIVEQKLKKNHKI